MRQDLEWEIRAFFDVVADDPAAAFYLRLARVTCRHLRRRGGSTGLLAYPTHGPNIYWLLHPDGPHPHRRLCRLWEAWTAEYRSLEDRHPRLALRQAMSAVSEASNRAAWPYGWEDTMRTWVDGGDYMRRRFPLHEPDFTQADYERLRGLRVRTAGWWRWSEKAGQPVFEAD